MLETFRIYTNVPRYVCNIFVMEQIDLYDDGMCTYICVVLTRWSWLNQPTTEASYLFYRARIDLG